MTISRLRGADRGEVRALDVAAVAQVVADHELRDSAARAVRPRSGRGTAALRCARSCTSSTSAHSRCIVCTIGASSGPRTRTAKSRRGGFWLRRVHVVDDVDAADEGDCAVDVAELAMHAPQAVRAELPRRDFRTVLEQMHAAVAQHTLEPAREVKPRAPTVDQHAHCNAASGGAHERIGDRLADRIVGEDVRLDPDLALRAVDGGRQRREELTAAAQAGRSRCLG